MSENVIIIITTTLGPIILALIGLRSMRLQQKGIERVEENTKITKEASEKVDENTKLTKATHDEVNSKMSKLIEVKDELLKVTGEAEKAKGVKEGKQEEKYKNFEASETRNKLETTITKGDEVVKVEVINTPNVEIANTPIEVVIPPKEEEK